MNQQKLDPQTEYGGMSVAEALLLCKKREAAAGLELEAFKALLTRPGYAKKDEKKKARDRKRLEAKVQGLVKASGIRQEIEEAIWRKSQATQGMGAVDAAITQQKMTDEVGEMQTIEETKAP